LTEHIVKFKEMEGAFINRNMAEEIFADFSRAFLRIDGYYLWQIPVALELRTYYKLFPEKRPAFSKILSDRISQAIKEGFPEKHIRVIQTACDKGRPRKSTYRRTQEFCGEVVEGGIGGLRFLAPDSDLTQGILPLF